MKAVVMNEFGGPDVLNYQDVETPEIGPDDVLVEVHAVSINRTFDLFMREDTYAYTPELPHILGVDPSGVITAVGENVTDRKVGHDTYDAGFFQRERDAAFGAYDLDLRNY